MDFATILGFVMGLGVLIAALCLAGVPWETLLSPEALLMVFGGTLTTVLVSFSGYTLKQALKAAKQCFYKEPFNTQECINYMAEVAAFVRTEGLLPMQAFLSDIEMPFLKKGLGLLIDNRSEASLKDNLSTEIEVTYREEMDYVRVFESAGGFAPTMGIIGAVIGIIHVVHSCHNPSQLGQGIAGAFSATLYGVALSNLILLPLAGKLRQRARHDWLQKTLILEGLLSIRAGEHPTLLEEKLKSFTNQVDSQPLAIEAPILRESDDLWASV